MSEQPTREDWRKGLRTQIEERCIPEPNSGCWIWAGCLRGNTGYGSMSSKHSKDHSAHRLSYMAFNGDIPAGLDVMHKCDVRSCVNPEHLTVGTRLENMRDCVSKKRIAIGTANGKSKLTPHQVIAIRADPRPHGRIALDYGVRHHTIQSIKYRTRWRHLP